MNLARLILAVSIAAAPMLDAQQPPAPTPPAAAAEKLPTFDVISVKVNTSGSRNISMGSTPDGLHATNIPVQLILKQAFAFAVNDSVIFGAPDWAQNTRFDIDAKVSGSDVDAFRALTNDQRRQMVVQILTARFHFAYHVETRTLPDYALVVAKGGSKLQLFQPGNDANGQPKHPGRMQVHDGLITAQGVPLDSLTHFLSDRVGRFVEDKTGLTGIYDFTLQLGEDHDAPMQSPNASPDAPAGPSIFTSLQEQLGLKLDAQKGPVQVLVVDHMELPASN